MLQTQSVDAETLGLLKELMQLDGLQPFSLVGGTALALIRGHRRSLDIDLFLNKPFDSFKLLEDLLHSIAAKDYSVLDQLNNKLSLHISGIKVEILSHQYPLLSPIVFTEGIRMYSLQDIAAMKLNAATNRGSKKDFYDLLELLEVYSLAEMLEFFKQKYTNYQVAHIVKSLSYFEDAELEPDPITLRGVTWKMVKDRMRQETIMYINSDL